MITTTPSPARSRRPAAACRRCHGGFTLIELMIGATLSGVLLLAVLSTVLFLGRSGANIVNYTSMEDEARVTLEEFAQDVRQASDLTWVNAAQVQLVVDSATITYGYDSTLQTFYRQIGSARTTLMQGVTSCTLRGYKITGATVSLTDLSLASRETKQLQLSMRAERKSVTAVRATDTVLSARFILRNKRVTS